MSSTTYYEAAQTLENFITGKGDPWDWDDFISGTKFKDPYLLSLQRRMDGLSNEFPADAKGQYCGPAGIEVIRICIQELRNKAAQQHHNRKQASGTRTKGIAMRLKSSRNRLN